MNDTIIRIDGIKLSQTSIDMEDSTDQAHTLKIKDEFGHAVIIQIIYGKITDCTHEKNSGR